MSFPNFQPWTPQGFVATNPLSIPPPPGYIPPLPRRTPCPPSSGSSSSTWTPPTQSSSQFTSPNFNTPVSNPYPSSVSSTFHPTPSQTPRGLTLPNPISRNPTTYQNPLSKVPSRNGPGSSMPQASIVPLTHRTLSIPFPSLGPSQLFSDKPRSLSILQHTFQYPAPHLALLISAPRQSFASPLLSTKERERQQRDIRRVLDRSMPRIMENMFHPGPILHTPFERMLHQQVQLTLFRAAMPLEMRSWGAPGSTLNQIHQMQLVQNAALVVIMRDQPPSKSTQMDARLIPPVYGYQDPTQPQSSGILSRLGRGLASRIMHDLYNAVYAPIASTVALIPGAVSWTAERADQERASIDHFFGTQIAAQDRILAETGMMYLELPLPKGITFRIKPGNLQMQIAKGQAPKSIIRADASRYPFEKDHVHFADGSALNFDGTWKHGWRDLSKKEVEWLQKNGWEIPKE